MADNEVKYLSPVDIELRQNNKYCRFKKLGIKLERKNDDIYIPCWFLIYKHPPPPHILFSPAELTLTGCSITWRFLF